jgi:lipopolysaccharide export system permease protein
MTLLTFVFNDVIVPSANLAAADTLDSALGRSVAAERGDNVVYSRYAQLTSIDEKGRERTGNDLAQLFYARRFREGKMYEVTLVDFTKAGHQQLLIAKTGTWNDPRSMWEFRDGLLTSIAPTTAPRRLISIATSIPSPRHRWTWASCPVMPPR